MNALTARAIATPTSPSEGARRPLGLGEVQITGGFWARRQELVGDITLPHIRDWLEKEGWIANFDLAAQGLLPEGRRGREFSDSEVYKYLEALAWEIGRRGREADETELRAVVARIAAAQEADGYLNTRFGRPGQGERWSDLEWGHELYCLGHLFQAAVARARTRPGSDDGLLGVATRAADLVWAVFGPDGSIPSVCGHAEIEPALVELGRVTGDERYTRLASLFVERRGRHVLADIEWGRSYYQDDTPIREASVLRGHAVRANYLSAGAVDVAVETGDHELLDVLATQWDATVARRTYITGGQGSRHQDEAFGEDWMLPPDRAYSETCAGIGSIMFSWRLLLARGEARYADLIERTLFNVVATGLGEDGRSFYYSNTLHRREPGEPAPELEVSPRAESSLRAPWFEVSCCPPNIARTIASLAGYLATATDDGIQLHQYAQSRVRASIAAGAVELRVTTDYPNDGAVGLEIVETPAAEWALTFRVPSWASGTRVVVHTSTGDEEMTAPAGTLELRRRFRVGDSVTLEFPMNPRITRADPRIDAVRGCVAVERGPEVLCLESIDLERDIPLDELLFDPGSLEEDGAVRARFTHEPVADEPWPYGERTGTRPDDGDVAGRLVPYHHWASRGPSRMRVWLPTR